MKDDKLLDEVRELEKTLENDGYKTWSYARLTVGKIIKLLETEQFSERNIALDEAITELQKYNGEYEKRSSVINLLESLKTKQNERR